MPKLWNSRCRRAPRNCSRVTRYGDTLAAARILYNCQDSSNVTDYYISFLIRGQSINAQTYFCGYFVKYYSGQNTMQIPSSHFNCWDVDSDRLQLYTPMSMLPPAAWLLIAATRGEPMWAIYEIGPNIDETSPLTCLVNGYNMKIPLLAVHYPLSSVKVSWQWKEVWDGVNCGIPCQDK